MALITFLLSLKRSAFNLRHQLKAERVQQLSRALHFAKICDSGFSRNVLGEFNPKRHFPHLKPQNVKRLHHYRRAAF